MAGLQRVPAPRVPFGGHGDLAAIGLIVVLAVLIAKPWGGASAPVDAGLALTEVPPTPAAEPTPFETGYAYDQSVFGPFEPRPEWSIWPAGFFVTVLYVTREARDDASEQPSTAAPGTSVATGIPQPAPATEPGSGWPAMITIGPGDHLLWLGINTPLEWTVRETAVWRREADGFRTKVSTVQLPSDWGPRFTVIGIPTSPGSDRLAVWARGSYDLEVTLAPGTITRSIRIEIETLAPVPTDRPEDRPR